MIESKYWVWTAKQTAELSVETLAPPADDEVLIRTRYTGISPGTEMALYMMTHVGFSDPDNTYASYPHRGGYLNVGVIEQAGARLAGRWPVGTWVFSSAGHCQYSLARPDGDEWSACYRLPETLHKPEGCFLGMARISYTSPYLAPGGLGEDVAVLGGGLVGNFAAQLYNVQGANVLVVEKDAFRRGIAEKCGLETVAATGEVAGFFGCAPQLVVEATGVPALCVEALRLAGEGGRVVILSSPRGQAPVNFYKHIHAKVITVIGAHGKALADKHAAARRIIDMAEKGRLLLAECLTHVESWREAPTVWQAYARGAQNRLGTVFDWEK